MAQPLPLQAQRLTQQIPQNTNPASHHQQAQSKIVIANANAFNPLNANPLITRGLWQQQFMLCHALAQNSQPALHRERHQFMLRLVQSRAGAVAQAQTMAMMQQRLVAQQLQVQQLRMQHEVAMQQAQVARNIATPTPPPPPAHSASEKRFQRNANQMVSGAVSDKSSDSSPSPTEARKDYRKLFVRKLTYSTTDRRLEEAFKQFGEVEEAVVLRDRETGRSKGHGFVRFKNSESAWKAMEQPQKDIDGHEACCHWAWERSKKQLIILRGMPGSGKTTKAKELERRSTNSRICSEDHYFYRHFYSHDGDYTFYGLARDKCNMEVRKAIDQGVGTIIVDNHNARINLYQGLIDYATKHGYRFRIIELVVYASLLDKCRRRSHTSLPRHVYSTMFQQWERDPRAKLEPAYDAAEDEEHEHEEKCSELPSTRQCRRHRERKKTSHPARAQRRRSNRAQRVPSAIAQRIDEMQMKRQGLDQGVGQNQLAQVFENEIKMGAYAKPPSQQRVRSCDL